MENGQLLPQPVFALARRADPAPDRSDMLPEGEVDPLHERLSLSRFLSGMMRL